MQYLAKVILTIWLAMGANIAAGVSYHLNHDFWWAVLHGVLGWTYVYYQIAENWTWFQAAFLT